MAYNGDLQGLVYYKFLVGGGVYQWCKPLKTLECIIHIKYKGEPSSVILLYIFGAWPSDVKQ